VVVQNELMASINGVGGLGSAWETRFAGGLCHVVGSMELPYEDALRFFTEQQLGTELQYSGRIRTVDGGHRDDTLPITLTGLGTPDDDGRTLVSFRELRRIATD
jgi:hypothetical protein